jgi:hypothetical protein
MAAADAIRESAEAHSRAAAVVIERACEQALQAGVSGVLVLTRNGVPVLASPHPDVPYGQIHYRPEDA